MSEARKRLVVFSDDWGRHPSSAQHLVRSLLDRYRVDWVNTIGTRRPSLTLADFKRGLEKLTGWIGRERPSSESDDHSGIAALPAPRIHAPVHWPGFGSRFERGLNRRLLLRALREVLSPEDPPDAVITTASIPADLCIARPELRWIYYCVDDLSEWPGLDGESLRTMEIDMLPHVETVIAVSEHLRERLASMGISSHLLTHGIERRHWAGIERKAFPTEGERPAAIFWGNADRRLDSEICLALAEVCELRIVGPRGEIDPRLANAAGITWIDAVPYAELPKVAAGADVLVMPYADLPVTRAMQPLKLKEYLATLLPVVGTPLPATAEWSAALDLELDAKRFAQRVLERANAPLPPEQVEARAALAEESWDEKARCFEDMIFPGEEA
jgi:glycosyltransferase involved in cell wall biosynthesis